MSEAGDGKWVGSARAGDRAAFAALVDMYWNRIRRWLLGLTGNLHLAEDVTQDAFVKAWIALPTLQVDASFRVWLFRIARNCLLDRRRKPLATTACPALETLSAKEVGPLTTLMEKEASQALEAALQRLPAPYRAAYLLWTQEELSYEEIAQILTIKQGAARVRVCLARQILVKEMQPYLDPPKS